MRIRGTYASFSDLSGIKGIDGVKLEHMLFIPPDEHFCEKYFHIQLPVRKHLDIQNITLCSGSRYLDGHVPRVRWYGGRLLVHWSFPGDSSGSLRSRQIVS